MNLVTTPTYVWTCAAFDDQGECVSAQWVEQVSVVQEFKAMLPTVEQANAVGMVYFSSIMLIAAMAVLKAKGV